MNTNDREMATPEYRFRVLLVEDDPADIFLVKRALEDLKRSGVAHAHLNIATRAEEAFCFLNDSLKSQTVPDLIVLDLRLPGMDGERFLAHLKSLEGLQDIPVFVLAGEITDDMSDRLYQLGASHVQGKLNSVIELAALFERVLPLWFV